MSTGIYVRDEIRAHILAAVVFAIRGAQAQGGDPRFIAGVLTLAEHNALAIEIDWSDLLSDARVVLGADTTSLLDQALHLETGASR